MPTGVIMMSLQKVIVAHTASLPNTACNGCVGVCRVFKQLFGLKPDYAQVTPPGAGRRLPVGYADLHLTATARFPANDGRGHPVDDN